MAAASVGSIGMDVSPCPFALAFERRNVNRYLARWAESTYLGRFRLLFAGFSAFGTKCRPHADIHGHMAISEKITFRYRDGRTQRLHRVRLPALQFLARFLQHVLPRGLAKVRY